jgi:ubiquinone/menaquinone biosynthesis C-methylase UbiE
MPNSDANFAGSIPALYDRCLGPLQFEPYAIDLAMRVVGLSPRSVLETAAGTGIVTVELAKRLTPGATITSTDLNQPMLDVAASKIKSPNVIWKQANAVALPFADEEFDAVTCQFGVMFFPDKLKAFQEACRVLKPGGQFIFNVWDRLELNEFSDVAAQAVAAFFPDNPSDFIRRVPFGYFDTDVISATLKKAGFSSASYERVAKLTRAPGAYYVALGLCQGTPTRNEIEARDPTALKAITAAVQAALEKRFGTGPVEGKTQAIVFTATR